MLNRVECRVSRFRFVLDQHTIPALLPFFVSYAGIMARSPGPDRVYATLWQGGMDEGQRPGLRACTTIDIDGNRNEGSSQRE